MGVYLVSSDQKARLSQRKDDSDPATLATASTSLSLTNSTWYTAKVVIDDDPGNSALQRLRFWVDTDNDASFSDETTLLDTTVVDDDWSAGYVGVYRHNFVSAATQFDDFKVGIDANADGDFDDAGDEIAINDDFNSATISLTYDNNGNLTDDGIFKFVYDAWNRLVAAKHRSAANAATIGTYAYDGANRRVSKVVANQGVEVTPNDGGNTTLNFYYGDVAGGGSAGAWGMSVPWSILEERNGSNQAVRAYLWGTRYIDELVWMESNGDPTIGNDLNPDVIATGEGSESPADVRYVAHQDRNWNVVGLTEYDTGGTSNGRVIERVSLSAYGEVRFVAGHTGYWELDTARLSSIQGHGAAHQGLLLDKHTDTYHNRARDYHVFAARFQQRDPAGTVDGLNLYAYERGNPVSYVDWTGLQCSPPNGCSSVPDAPGGYNFRACCDEHDECYCTCGVTKDQCDQDFYRCMLRVCARAASGARPRRRAHVWQQCWEWAYTYYWGVDNFGLGWFCDAQAAEHCCMVPECPGL